MLSRCAWARFTAKRAAGWAGVTYTIASDCRLQIGAILGDISYDFFAYSLDEGDAQPNGTLHGHCLCS